MGAVAACGQVNHCCSNTEKGTENAVVASKFEPSAALRTDLPHDVRLVAWFRRRSGPDCDFGEVFEELFGSRDSVGTSKFVSVLKERGASTQIDAAQAFRKIDAMSKGKGAVGAAELETWQEAVEKKEVEGLRIWRDWLRKRYATPSAAFHAMGKGEGDVLVESEFKEALAKINFEAEDPAELFRFMDKDFSGEITFAEFKSAMRSVGIKRVKDRRSSVQLQKESRKSQQYQQSSKNTQLDDSDEAEIEASDSIKRRGSNDTQGSKDRAGGRSAMKKKSNEVAENPDQGEESPVEAEGGN